MSGLVRTTSAHERELWGIFCQIDTDGNGTLDAAEVGQFVRKLRPSRYMDMCIQEMDGKDEIAELMSAINPGAASEAPSITFKQFAKWWISGGEMTSSERAAGGHSEPSLPSPSGAAVDTASLERSLAAAVATLVRQKSDESGTQPEPEPDTQPESPLQEEQMSLELEPWGDAAWVAAAAAAAAGPDCEDISSGASVPNGGSDTPGSQRGFRYAPGDEGTVLSTALVRAREGKWDRVSAALQGLCREQYSSAQLLSSSDHTDAALRRVEFILSQCWPLLPEDTHDKMQLDPRIAVPLVDSAGPSFRVIWWRVLALLHYIPHSEEADRQVVITIYRRRRTNAAGTWWEETSHSTDDHSLPPGSSADGDCDEVHIRCKIAMTLAEAHAAVLATGLSSGPAHPLVTHDGYTYGGPHAASAVELEFFSHRWARPYWEGCGFEPVRPSAPAHPDDAQGSKAKALVKYGSEAAEAAAAAVDSGSGWRGEKCFWIDYACVDQTDPAPGIAMLPLYTALCERLLFHDSVEYDRRGWTRAERAIFAAFNKPHFTAIGHKSSQNMSLQRTDSKKKHITLKLADPARAPDPLSDPAKDGPILERLVGLARRQWGVSWRGSAEQWESFGLKGLRRLVFGETECMFSDERHA